MTAAAIKRHGKHYTPTDLARFMSHRILQHLPQSNHLRILDPACGDGELLFAIYEEVAKKRPETTLDLVGYDLDSEAIRFAQKRAMQYGITISLRPGDFLEMGRSLPPHSFDAIITNPPYVRTQQLGQEAAQLLAAEFGLKGRIDLTHPFVTMCPELLKVGGVVGLLCSNRFLTTKAGANIRSILQTRLSPVELYDLGDTKLFEAAVLPAITIAINRHPDPLVACKFVSAYQSSLNEPSFTGNLLDALAVDEDCVVLHDGRAVVIKVGRLTSSKSHIEPWRVSHVAGDDWLEGLQASTWRTFGDVAKIRVGIKTTADSVFISNNWDATSPEPEAELLLPLITHYNVEPWRISSEPATRVLYPYDLQQSRRTLVDVTKYPNTMKYFDNHAERLKGRNYVTAGGREWYEIWVPQRPSKWAYPKIIFPDISENARFAYDSSGAIVNGDCYWISLEDIGDENIAYLMLAVANSALGVRFYDEMCGNKLYSGRRRWMSQYVARLPLPNPKSDSSQAVIRAVKEILDSPSTPKDDLLKKLDALVEESFLNGSADMPISDAHLLF